MNDYPEIAARFARETAGHQMTVLHDDGLYRHLRFRRPSPESSMYWFDLITWPGCLTIRGDIGETYTFSRLDDMFQFFRRQGINPSYWAEKLAGGSDSAREYSDKAFRQRVCQLVGEAVQGGNAPRGLGKAVRTNILSYDFYYEREARERLESFEHEGYSFRDTWELSFDDFGWSFIWACHAIVWGIARYDRARKYGLENLAAPEAVTA